jgi:CRISPR/Cas system-associated endonuclease/helicase Cas3
MLNESNNKSLIKGLYDVLLCFVYLIVNGSYFPLQYKTNILILILFSSLLFDDVQMIQMNF